jgi:hypothetical protein
MAALVTHQGGLMTTPEENRRKTAKTDDLTVRPRDDADDSSSGPSDPEQGNVGDALRRAMDEAAVDRDDFA